jgi:hypothetical protein
MARHPLSACFSRVELHCIRGRPAEPESPYSRIQTARSSVFCMPGRCGLAPKSCAANQCPHLGRSSCSRRRRVIDPSRPSPRYIFSHPIVTPRGRPIIAPSYRKINDSTSSRLALECHPFIFPPRRKRTHLTPPSQTLRLGVAHALVFPKPLARWEKS